MKIDDKLGAAYRGAAWIMATCPDERFRNPEAALAAAQKAMEFDGDKDPRYIDTLAAAYAVNGQFDSAGAILEAHMDKIPANWKPTIQSSDRALQGAAAAARRRESSAAVAAGSRSTATTAAARSPAANAATAAPTIAANAAAAAAAAVAAKLTHPAPGRTAVWPAAVASRSRLPDAT